MGVGFVVVGRFVLIGVFWDGLDIFCWVFGVVLDFCFWGIFGFFRFWFGMFVFMFLLWLGLYLCLCLGGC